MYILQIIFGAIIAFMLSWFLSLFIIEQSNKIKNRFIRYTAIFGCLLSFGFTGAFLGNIIVYGLCTQ